MTPLSSQQVEAFVEHIPSTKFDELMSKHTSFRIGGPARLYVVAHSSDEAVAAIRAAQALKIPFYLFGGGSNMLVADQGYEGVMIQLANRTLSIEGTKVMVESGVITGLVARKTVESGLTGFEWAIGVPGTIGGAIYGDAGCYGGEMRDSVTAVHVYDLTTHEYKTLDREACEFGYRESRFKRESFLILGCELELTQSEDIEKGKKRMEEIMQMRKEKQPLEQSSAGCAFKNFEFDDPSVLDILRREVDVPEDMIKRGSLGAGWLVDQAGFRGQSVGQIEVSQKHGNFLVNKGQAKAEDVIAMISVIKRKIRDEFGIEMHEEVQYVGF